MRQRMSCTLGERNWRTMPKMRNDDSSIELGDGLEVIALLVTQARELSDESTADEGKISMQL